MFVRFDKPIKQCNHTYDFSVAISNMYKELGGVFDDTTTSFSVVKAILKRCNTTIHNLNNKLKDYSIEIIYENGELQESQSLNYIIELLSDTVENKHINNIEDVIHREIVAGKKLDALNEFILDIQEIKGND